MKRKRYVESIELPDGIYFTVKSLADKYRISESQVYKIKDRFKIKQQQIGGMIVIKDDDRFAAPLPSANGGLFKSGDDDRRIRMVNYSELVAKIEKLTEDLHMLARNMLALDFTQKDGNKTLNEILDFLTQGKREASGAENGNGGNRNVER